MDKPFQWVKTPPSPEVFETRSTQFIKSLPPTPVRSHLAYLYGLFLHGQEQVRGLSGVTPNEDAMAESLTLFEYHLQQIARFTKLDPYTARQIVENHQRQAQPRVRRVFPKKEK